MPQMYKKALGLLALVVSVSLHPQCNDFRAPFQASEDGFCSHVEVGDLSCCPSALQRHLDARASQAKLSPSCLQVVKRVLCIQCHPYAEHIFTTPNDGLYPGLCPVQCQELQLECLNEAIPLGLNLSVTVTSSSSFCEPFVADDAGYCYPDTPAINQDTIHVTNDGHLCLQPVSTGWYNALALVQPNDGLHRLAVIEQQGLVWMVDEADMQQRYMFLDLRPMITQSLRTRGDERGLLSIVFHPEFRDNRLFYVHHSGVDDVVFVAEYQATSDFKYGDPATRRVVLSV